MKLVCTPDQDRRFAWTDRKGGYVELNSAVSGILSTGYVRGERTLWKDFFLGGPADVWRTNAERTEVEPSGARFFFTGEGSERVVSLSLLVNREALAFTLEETSGSSQSSPEAAAERPSLGLLFPPAAADAPIAADAWARSEAGNFTLWTNGAGTAIVSSTPFALETSAEGQVILHPESLPALWYVAFGPEPPEAEQRARSLAEEDALACHRREIEGFLESARIRTGDDPFDEALAWARFSGWMLVTDDGPRRGIWAGLPWFRDNWGRDTFIALSGILLAGGQFAEARSVLEGFASHQNRDPGSPDWGRIPNRWRGPQDVIYNTADGTLWFIRALWEYLEYTGDRSILAALAETVDLALRSDLERRTDDRGFLLHGDADTWMDARIRGREPWSPRGDRAVDIQALWYAALRIGARLARLSGDGSLARERDAAAERVRASFIEFFWSPERQALADRLPPGPHGEWARDFSVRPNQLFALTAPSVLGPGEELLGEAERGAVLENVERELLSPFGLFSLSPEDPRFHPRHEDDGRYHKDAAYHNGTIWVWNSGPWVSASVRFSRDGGERTGVLPAAAEALLRNEARMLLQGGCAGTLSENLHALPDDGGNPVRSGTWSQAWSVSEFTRNIHEDVVGFRPRLMEGEADLKPSLPAGLTRLEASLPLGDGRVSLRLERDAAGRLSAALLLDRPLSALEGKPLRVNGEPLEPGKPLTLVLGTGRTQEPAFPRNPLILNRWITEPFPERDLTPPWCGPLLRRDWLETLILSRRSEGSGGGPLTAEMEGYFDSDLFRNTRETRGVFGALWSAEYTDFRLWAPTARSAELLLWETGDPSAGGEPKVLPAVRGRGAEADGAGYTDAGTWSVRVPGDLHGTYYTWRLRIHGILRETADPYARAAGVNGRRSMVVDFSRTDPPGWDSVSPPPVKSPNDAVVYELHVADASSSPTWRGPESLRRRYGGVTAGGITCVSSGGRRFPAGFDHLRDLGITHVQLLPVFDFSSVDESLHDDLSYGSALIGGKFNWGYDPGNYCLPEGSYATDPFDGTVRIRELKSMIRDFLRAGIGVIMDVVYNHVPAAQDHPLGITVPGYYFRREKYSGAGDDTASERPMFRSYMIDSLCHWLREYKLSGFRFDLMGLHDVAAMNAVQEALRKIRGDVLLYGEGWDMYRGGKTVGASMKEAKKMAGIGFFNDAFRCAVKGDAFIPSEGGFIHDGSRRESLKFGLVGAVYHPQVHNRLVRGTANPNPWTDRTASSIPYTEIHDNTTLYDKLLLVENGATEERLETLQKTAIGLVLLSQGMPILHGGMEFMRTKEIARELLEGHPGLHDLYRTAGGERAFSHNTYNLSDRVNGLDWDRRAEKDSVVSFTRTLIALRRAHAHFRLRTEGEVKRCLSFLGPDGKPLPTPAEDPRAEFSPAPRAETGDAQDLLAWMIDDPFLNGADRESFPGSDPWTRVCVAVNPSEGPRSFALPAALRGGFWHLSVSSLAQDGPEGPLGAGAETVIPPKALYLYAEF